MKSAPLTGFLLWFSLICTAQSYRIKFDRLGTHEGLSHNTIRTATEDHDHNLWVGTDDGLNMYNGFEIREFTSANTPLKSDLVRTIHVLSDGRLVIQTAIEDRFNHYEGLYLLNPGYMITRLPGFDQHANDDGLTDRQFYHDAFYTVGGHQLWKYTPLEDRWTYENLPQGFEAGDVVDGFITGHHGNRPCLVHVTRPGNILFTDDLPAIDSTFALLYHACEKMPDLGGISMLQTALYDPVHHLVWIRKSHRLYAADPGGHLQNLNTLNGYLAFDERLESVSINTQGMLMLSTYNGLLLTRVSPLRFTTHKLLLPDGRPIPPTPQTVRGIWVADHQLFMNVNQYFARQNLADHSPAEILYTSDGGKLFAMHGGTHAIWSGRHQLIRYDLHTHQTEVIAKKLPDAIAGLWSIYWHDYVCYLGGQNGVTILDSTDLSHGIYRELCASTDTGQFKIVYQIAKTSLGLFYVTSKGLFLASPDPCTPDYISFLNPDGSTAKNRQFTHLYEDTDHSFWLASQDGGVIHCQVNGSTAIILDVVDRQTGLTTNTTYAVYPDESGSLWISTDHGIIQYDRAAKSFTQYTMEDGLPDDEFNRLSHFRDTAGRIYFGGQDGVVSFDPTEFYADEPQENSLRLLKVTQFVAWDDTIMDVTDDILNSGRIIFHPGDKFIRFQTGLTDLFRAREQQYEYRIEEIHPAWQPMQVNVLTINMLPYGKHTLEIRARNAEGRFSKKTLDILMIARRPVYLRWWFITLVLGGLVLVIREYWLNRTRRAVERAAELEEQVRERTATISRQADALRDLQQVRSRFFANISHELRTPLTLIRGPVQSLLDRSSRNENDRAYLDLIRKNAVTLGDRIDDLLLLSRMDARQLKVYPTDFNLISFLERIMDVFRVSAAEKHIQLEFDHLIGSPVFIRTDQKKLEHILSNYLSNAIKFTPENGRIVLKTDLEDEKTLNIAVRDNGPGISPEDADKVFDRFYQASGEHKKNTGTGIGLSICKELAEILGGNAGVESMPGAGSTFFVKIPFVPVEEIQSTSERDAEKEVLSSALTASQKKQAISGTLLIVEDNAALRDFLRLELNSFDVRTAENGKIALELLERLRQEETLPDCIISDVMMPEMDGFELLHAIKSDPVLAGIPVIMLTARAGVEDKLEALRIGVHDYITKPFLAEELRVRIANLIRHQSEKKAAVAEEPEALVMDHPWLKEVEAEVMAHLSERDYSVARLAAAIFLSESQLLRRLKALTGLTPGKYLREVRLYHAKALLESGEYMTVGTLSAAVGFEDPDYFSRIFMERFGFRPADKI